MNHLTLTVLGCTIASLIGCQQDSGSVEEDRAPPGQVLSLLMDGDPVRYVVVGDLAMYQGDIILGDARALAAAGPDVGAGHPPARDWERGTVPYEISDAFHPADRAAVIRMVAATTAHFRHLTGVEFIPRRKHADYVTIRPLSDDAGCGASYLGRQGGEQSIYFAPYCGFGGLVHHVGHTLGLGHEHARRDRDHYVEVRLGNVVPQRDYLFDLAPRRFDGRGEYDYYSIMHGWAGTAAKGACDEYDDSGCTIVPRDRHVSAYDVGQRNGLSVGDAQGLCARYENPTDLRVAKPGGPPIELNTGARVTFGPDEQPALDVQLRWRWVPERGAIRVTSDRDGVLHEAVVPGDGAKRGGHVPLPQLSEGVHTITLETLQHCHTRFDLEVEV